MSPLMKKVEKAGIKGIKQKRKPWQITGDHFFHETETIRLLFSQLINNAEPNRVVIIPSASYGLANAAHNLPFSGGKILLVEDQFPSNVYPWQSLVNKGFEVELVSPPKAEKRGESWNTKLLDSIDSKTKVVAIGHVHWSDGTLFKLKEIREKLDKVGGLLIIDGTQSIGALPFDVAEIRPDALICAGYKWLMGPYSIGLAYYGKAFDNGQPIEENWINRYNSEDFTGLVKYESRYRDLALRYEVGEHSNFILIPMLHQALKQLLRWTPENIQLYCKELMATSLGEIQELGYEIESSEFRAHHLFGLRVNKNINLDDLKKAMDRNKVSVSYRGDAIRIAPHVYNDEMDVRKLLNALKAPIFASKD